MGLTCTGTASPRPPDRTTGPGKRPLEHARKGACSSGPASSAQGAHQEGGGGHRNAGQREGTGNGPERNKNKKRKKTKKGGRRPRQASRGVAGWAQTRSDRRIQPPAAPRAAGGDRRGRKAKKSKEAARQEGSMARPRQPLCRVYGSSRTTEMFLLCGRPYRNHRGRPHRNPSSYGGRPNRNHAQGYWALP